MLCSGTFAAPLDEAYSTCDVDLVAADPSLSFDLAPYGPGEGRARIGKYQTKLTQPFWEALTREAGVGVRLVKRRGDNAHHIVEASFKSFARCLRSVMDQVEGVDVVAMNERLEGVTRGRNRAGPASPGSCHRGGRQPRGIRCLSTSGTASRSRKGAGSLSA